MSVWNSCPTFRGLFLFTLPGILYKYSEQTQHSSNKFLIMGKISETSNNNFILTPLITLEVFTKYCRRESLNSYICTRVIHILISVQSTTHLSNLMLSVLSDTFSLACRVSSHMPGQLKDSKTQGKALIYVNINAY
jgi:hypothetical protein